MTMRFVEDSSFNEYVEAYKKLPLQEKKDVVLNDFKELIAVLKEIDTNDLVLYNKEILDAEKEVQTEDDFVEAIFVYLSSVKEMFSNIILEQIEKED